MGIRIYLSNKQDKLAIKCAQNLSVFKSVFKPVNIVTQTAGMNRWLSITIAEHNGIFGNFKFQTPNSLINRLFYLARLRTSELFETEKTRWLVYHSLGEQEFKNTFPKIAAYYLEDHIKQLQLATRVADLFDQYFVYRPELIQSWNENKKTPFKNESYETHALWQSYLWQKLREKLADSSQDKVTLKSALAKKFKEPEFIELLNKEITGISLFGLSLLTEFHMEIIHHLSQCIQVDLYFLNPAPFEFWYDNKDQNLIAYIEKKTGKSREALFLHEGNTLLSSMGRAGQNSFSVFFNDADFINSIDDELSVEPVGSSLLATVQSDIFHNKSDDLRHHISHKLLSDGSVQIKSCYTIAREVEVLYNYLLQQFETKPDLKPKDIIVMCSNIDAYAPYIQAIFDLAPKNRSIPYSIADQSYSDSNDLLGALETILNLSADYFPPEKVLQVCENPLVSKCYGISNHQYVQQLIDHCNIRGSISGSSEDHSKFISWKFGLEKIILSYAMEDFSPFGEQPDTTYTIEGVESDFGREALRFYSFAQDLIGLTLESRQARPLQEWKKHIENIIDTMFSLAGADAEEVNYLRVHLNKLDDMEGHFNKKVPFDVFKNAFISSLFTNQRSGRFITGRVTFSSMIPMRSIPFKTVALLGVDRDKFPRRETRLGFNLIDAEKRRSDRNVRDNDKYLFLESILSAENSLYLSYIGQNSQDGTSIQPSIVIDELINYISRKSDLDYKVLKSILVETSPLHAFIASENTQNRSLPYSSAVLPYTGLEVNKTRTLAPETRQIELENVLRFFQDPFKFHYNKVLAIYLDEKDESIKDSELFELDTLQNYWLKEQVLSENFDEEPFIDRYEKSGLLPLKTMAKVPVARQLQELSKLKSQRLELIGHNPETLIPFDLNLEGTILVGEIKNVYDKSIVVHHFGSEHSKEKKKIRLCMLSLVVDILELELKVILIDVDGKTEHYNKNGLSVDGARTILKSLLDFVDLGLSEIVCFAPLVLLQTNKSKSADQILSQIEKEGETSHHKTWYNPYIKIEKQHGYFQRNIPELQAQFETIRSLLKCYE
jgi:exodeoxyribonuclease V gamma subunit